MRLPKRVESGNSLFSCSTGLAYAGNGAFAAHTEVEQSWATLVYPFAATNEGTVYFAGWWFVPEDTISGTIKLINLAGYKTEAADENVGVDINVSADRILDMYVHGKYTRFESHENLVPAVGDVVLTLERNCSHGE